jgi:hypothetical protein
MADSRFFNLIRKARDTQSTQQPKIEPTNLAGTTSTIPDPIRKSDAAQDANPNGRTGNNWPTPTADHFAIEADPGARRQDIANTHLSDGITPGRIPYIFNIRNGARLGKGMSGNPSGTQGLLLGITGERSGGMGDASYIPHTSVLRPAGKSVGSLRTIDDGAQVPGVYLADPTRR